MKVTLSSEELVAIKIAECALRSLPTEPCKSPFPFFELNNLQSSDVRGSADDTERVSVSFDVDMRSGRFDFTSGDYSRYPKFNFVIGYDEKISEYFCCSAHVEYKFSENRLHTIDFTAVLNKQGEIIIKRI